MKHLIYYILNFTWGIIMNIIGGIGALAMLALGHKPIRHGGSICFRFGRGWGGVSLGIFTFVSTTCDDSTLDHEFGHSLQNALYGPFFIFLVAIPSFIRCQIYNSYTAKGIPMGDYDAIWFEKQATEWGTKMIKNW